jgi:hypothetical protein
MISVEIFMLGENILLIQHGGQLILFQQELDSCIKGMASYTLIDMMMEQEISQEKKKIYSIGIKKL